MKLRADYLDESGRGVGMAEGLEVRVTDLLPGEHALVDLDHRSPHEAVAWARVRQRLSESVHRREPACPAFTRCGGCAWQHLDYAEQLVCKHRLVAEALGRDDVLPVVAAPAELGYRNKGKYVVGRVDGRVVLGAYAPRTHELVDTIECRVVSPAIAAVAARAREAIEATGLAPYDEQTRTGVARYAVIREGSDGRCSSVLVTTSDAARGDVANVCTRIGGDAVWMRNDVTSGAIITDDFEVIAGRGFAVEQIADVQVEVGPGAFFQINRDQAARMYRDIAAGAVAPPAGDVAPPGRAVDLYSGIGGIAFSLAGAGFDVTGIERDPAAVAAANRAASFVPISGQPSSLRPRSWRPRSCRFLSGDAAALSRLADEIDLVVVNPPRRGLGGDAMAAVRAAAPARLVYVSCGPRSLARDLAVLEGDGYAVDRVQPYDLMPGTGQVETVVFLHR